MYRCPNYNKDTPVDNMSAPVYGYRYSDGVKCRSDLSTGLPVSSTNKEGPFAPKMCLGCKETLSQEHFHTKPLHNSKGTTYRLRYLCKECERVNHRARSIAWYRRRVEELETLWNTWSELLSVVPIVAFTEYEWALTCRYFKGCALCSSKHIETKEFFQKPIYKGTYSALNMLPMCAKCASLFRNCDNPFEYFSPFKSQGTNMPTARAKLLADFILNKLKEFTA